MTGRQRALLFAVALGVRLLPLLVADREGADVLR